MTGLRLTEIAAVVERASTRLRGEDARRCWQRWCQGCRCRCLVALAAVWLAGSGPLVPLASSDAVALVLPKPVELVWPGRFFLAGGAGWMSAGDCSGAVVGPRLLGVAAGLWCGLGTALSAREHGSAASGSASLGLPVQSSLAKAWPRWGRLLRWLYWSRLHWSFHGPSNSFSVSAVLDHRFPEVGFTARSWNPLRAPLAAHLQSG